MHVSSVVVDVIAFSDQIHVLFECPSIQRVAVEVVLVLIHIFELLLDEIDVAETWGILAFVQEASSHFDLEPHVLEIVRGGFSSHEGLHRGFGKFRLQGSQLELDADIVHVSISKVKLPSLVDNHNSLLVLVEFLENIGFDHTKLD